MLHRWYNGSSENFPLSIPMKFIPSKDNPDIENNSIALQNISIIYERQRIFLRDTVTVTCPYLADLTVKTKTGATIRKALLNTKIRTSISAYSGGLLFHALTTKTTHGGDQIHSFTFHRAFEKEARNIIGGMPQFIETELGEDPEMFCHAHLIEHSHAWNKLTRTVKNSTTDYLSALAGSEEISEIEDDEDYDMDSKAYRECCRLVGINKAETVVDMKTRRKAKKGTGKVPTQINDSGSLVSDMTGMTVYSSQTQASKHRKELRSKVNNQQIALSSKDDEIEKLRAQLALLSGNPPQSIAIPSQPNPPDGEVDGNNQSDPDSEQVEIIPPPESQRQGNEKEDSIESDIEPKNPQEDQIAEVEPKDSAVEALDFDSTDGSDLIAGIGRIVTQNTQVRQEDPPNEAIEVHDSDEESDKWCFEENEQEMKQDDERSHKVLAEKYPFIARGSNFRIEKLKESMEQQGKVVVCSHPLRDGTVSLYLIRDATPDPLNVRFQPDTEVQEYNPLEAQKPSPQKDNDSDSEQSVKGSSSSSTSGKSDSSKETASGQESKESVSSEGTAVSISSTPRDNLQEAKNKARSSTLSAKNFSYLESQLEKEQGCGVESDDPDGINV